MQSLLLSIPFLSVISPTQSAEKEQEACRQLIRRALYACQAPAGEQALAIRCKYDFRQGKEKQADMFLEFFGETGGTRCRLSMYENSENKIALLTREGRHWYVGKNERMELKDEMADVMTEIQHAERVFWLLPLLQDKRFSFTSLGESAFKGIRVLGIRVSYPKRQNVSLYFDKAKGTLCHGSHTMDIKTEKFVVQREFKDFRAVSNGAAEEKFLRQAKIDTGYPSLAKLLRGPFPDAALKKRIHEHIEALGDASFAVRDKAKLALQTVGTAAIPILRTVQDKDLETLLRCRGLLHDLKADQVDQQRKAAIRLLAWRKSAGAVDTLLACLETPWTESEKHEIQAALAALAMRDGKPDPALLKAQRGPEPLRTLAASALAKDGGGWANQPGRPLYLNLRIAHHIVWTLETRNEKQKKGTQETFEMRVVELETFNCHPDHLFDGPKGDEDASK